MTYLVENENAALLLPARFLAQLHPHFREVMQLLAIQTADEARHIEVFNRRITVSGLAPGLSSAGGQASLRSLFADPDYATTMFLLSVMGEGSFLSLLWFLHQHGPDLATRTMCKLAAQDEARHVAFAMAHLTRHLGHEPSLRSRLARAADRRHQDLRHTTGLNDEVFAALCVLAGGGERPEQLAHGYQAVQAMAAEMNEGRQRRLVRLGFTPGEAEAISGLHTRNFM
jgi:hypothetical protein